MLVIWQIRLYYLCIKLPESMMIMQGISATTTTTTITITVLITITITVLITITIKDLWWTDSSNRIYNRSKIKIMKTKTNRTNRIVNKNRSMKLIDLTIVWSAYIEVQWVIANNNNTKPVMYQATMDHYNPMKKNKKMSNKVSSNQMSNRNKDS